MIRLTSQGTTGAFATVYHRAERAPRHAAHAATFGHHRTHRYSNATVVNGVGGRADGIVTIGTAHAVRSAVGGLLFINGHRTSGSNADTTVAGSTGFTAVGCTVTQRVGEVFYRMCAVYRARIGFASQGSLNPVRPWS